jgi:hypothetical protein
MSGGPRLPGSSVGNKGVWFRGEMRRIADLCREFGVKRSTFERRRTAGDSVEQALRPVQPRIALCELLAAYKGGKLSARLAQSMRQHVAVCPRCQERGGLQVRPRQAKKPQAWRLPWRGGCSAPRWRAS